MSKINLDKGVGSLLSEIDILQIKEIRSPEIIVE